MSFWIEQLWAVIRFAPDEKGYPFGRARVQDVGKYVAVRFWYKTPSGAGQGGNSDRPTW